MFTIACCLVVGLWLRLDIVSGWLVVICTYLDYFALSLSLSSNNTPSTTSHVATVALCTQPDYSCKALLHSQATDNSYSLTTLPRTNEHLHGYCCCCCNHNRRLSHHELRPSVGPMLNLKPHADL